MHYHVPARATKYGGSSPSAVPAPQENASNQTLRNINQGVTTVTSEPVLRRHWNLHREKCNLLSQPKKYNLRLCAIKVEIHRPAIVCKERRTCNKWPQEEKECYTAEKSSLA
jgi:hypothetical protein